MASTTAGNHIPDWLASERHCTSTSIKLYFKVEFGMRISPFVPDYHLLVTSSVKGGLLFSATWPGYQPLPQLIMHRSCRSTPSQQISQCWRLEAPSRSSARAVGGPTVSG